MIRIPEKLSTKLSKLVNSTNSRWREALRNNCTSLHQYRSCWLCDEVFETRELHEFCPACRADLPRINTACRYCALPITMPPANETSPESSTEAEPEQFSLACGECIKQPSAFSLTIASYQYSFPVKQLIRRTKYQKQRYWLKPLTNQLIADLKQAPAYTYDALPELLIPVPMYPKKQKERTFNQAALIAKKLSRALKIRVRADILLKTQDTERQALLSKAQRKKNLSQAFSIARNNRKSTLLNGKHIALIDDVMTTKATAHYAAKRLLAAGARRVDIWCLARTPKY